MNLLTTLLMFPLCLHCLRILKKVSLDNLHSLNGIVEHLVIMSKYSWLVTGLSLGMGTVCTCLVSCWGEDCLGTLVETDWGDCGERTLFFRVEVGIGFGDICLELLF